MGCLEILAIRGLLVIKKNVKKFTKSLLAAEQQDDTKEDHSYKREVKSSFSLSTVKPSCFSSAAVSPSPGINLPQKQPS